MKTTEELLEELLNDLDDLAAKYTLYAEKIPDIGLYMDQVTSLMEDDLQREKRYPDDKILTKTMINNYTKNHLLPPPDKKKYSRDHVLIMIFIYYYKNILTFRDIEQLFKPLTENHFNTDSDISLSEIYDRLCSLANSRYDQLKEDIKEELESARKAFEDVSTEDSEYLKLFAFISELFTDIYIKKKVTEYLIDNLAEENEKRGAPARKKK